MKNFRKSSMIIVSSILLLSGLVGGAMTYATGPTAVDLLSSKNFAILSKTAITNVPTSSINGSVGASPITGAAIGLSCPEVTGTIYSVDAAGPLPCRITDAGLLSVAVNDMEAAYIDAAGRISPTDTELSAGNIGGLTIAPGLYKWSTDVNIATDITLSGGANDVWIFQISGNLTIASAQKVILLSGANASNVFWQVGGTTGATLGTTSTFNGTILSAKQIILQTGATLNGRALAQTQIVLDQNTINVPTPVIETTPIVVPSTGGGYGPGGGSSTVDEPTSVVEPTPTIEPTPVVETTPIIESTPVVEPTPTIEPTSIVEITPIIEPTSIVENTPTDAPTPTVVPTPNFPNAGLQEKNNTGIIAIIMSIIVLLSISISVIIKKHNA